MLKVMTVVGTRPEIIRLSRVIDKLDRHCNHVLVHTGQNYDYELNEVFFQELGIRRPAAVHLPVAHHELASHRWPPYQVRTILPTWVLDSISACACAAWAAANTWWITGLTRPASISGQTVARKACAIAVL